MNVESRINDGALGRAAPRVNLGAAATGRRTARLGYSLGELAERFGCTVKGDADVRLTHVASLQDADEEAIGFIANPKYLPLLESTRAGAVILSPQHAQHSQIPALIARNPYATYARIGDNTRLVARVTVCADVSIGQRCILHPGVVVGSDGFGNAPDNGSWVKIPQLGSVQVGDDVEIGANTTIDRGTLQDTVIEEGVRLDNLIQVAHNVRIGAHTAIAALVGIAGSTTIGKHCVIAGKVGIADQLEICDGVTVMAMTAVGASIHKPGVYSGAIGMDEVTKFRRSAVRFRQLDEMAKDIRALKKDHLQPGG